MEERNKRPSLTVDANNVLAYDDEAWDHLDQFAFIIRHCRSIGHVNKLLECTMLNIDKIKRKLAIMMKHKQLLLEERDARFEELAENLEKDV